jgi:hypothetical protein
MYNECRHIKDDGQRCHAAALKTKPYCFFHMKFDRMHRRDRIEIPPIEDSTSVLLAIGQVVRALNYETINCRRAGLMLYGLQIAASVASRKEQAEPVDAVRSVHYPSSSARLSSPALRCSLPKTPSASPSTIAPFAIEPNPARSEKPFSRTAVQIIQTTISITRNARGRKLREELYAILQEPDENGEMPERPLPSLEEFHRYFTLQASSAESPQDQPENSPARNAAITNLTDTSPLKPAGAEPPEGKRENSGAKSSDHESHRHFPIQAAGPESPGGIRENSGA